LDLVKDPGNTFELNPKWERTLLSFDNFYGIFIALPQNRNIKVDISHPAAGLRCRIPYRHLCQLKALIIPTWGIGQRYCPGL
jgi:hypothetical protein